MQREALAMAETLVDAGGGDVEAHGPTEMSRNDDIGGRGMAEDADQPPRCDGWASLEAPS